jgi:hypothetical protein
VAASALKSGDENGDIGGSFEGGVWGGVVRPLEASSRIKAAIDLTLGDQFAADRERGVARLVLDLVANSELGKGGARDGARGVGDRGIGVCERMRSEHGRLQLLGCRNVRDGVALLHHHTDTDACERYAAHRGEVAG